MALTAIEAAEHQFMFEAARHELLKHFLFDIFAPHVVRSRAALAGAHENDYHKKLGTEFQDFESAVLAFVQPPTDAPKMGAVDIYCSVLRERINEVDVYRLLEPFDSPDAQADLWRYQLREDILARVESLRIGGPAFTSGWAVDFVRNRLREDILDPIKELTYLWFMLVQQGIPSDFRDYLKNKVLPPLLNRRTLWPVEVIRVGNREILSDGYITPEWTTVEVDQLCSDLDNTVEDRLKHGGAMAGVRELIRLRAEEWQQSQQPTKQIKGIPVRRFPSEDELRRAGLPKDIVPYEVHSENGLEYLTAYSNSPATVNRYMLKAFEDEIELARGYCQQAGGQITVDQVLKEFPNFRERAPGDTLDEKFKWIQTNIIDRRDEPERSKIREAAAEIYRHIVDAIPELAKHRPSQIETRNPREVRAELAARFYKSLDTLKHATRLKRKSEETLRQEHPEMVDFWQAVGDVKKEIREEFFAVKVYSKRASQLFEFMANHLIGGISGTTLHSEWKKFRAGKLTPDTPKNP